MSDQTDRPRSLKRTAMISLAIVAGLPASFVLLSPLIALAGYATGWFDPGAIGKAVGVILIGAAVMVGIAAAVLAVVVALFAIVGTTAVTVFRAVAHVFSRLP